MNNRFIALSLLILAAAFSRLIPHPANFTPIGAMALFSGVYFMDKKFSFIVPLLAMFLSDLILGFHRTLPYVYVSLGLITLMGIWQGRNISKPWVLPVMTVVSSLLFFFVTNFGTWAAYNFYPHTPAGLQTALVAGLPFLKNTILGDVAYVTALFGTWALLKSAVPSLKLQAA